MSTWKRRDGRSEVAVGRVFEGSLDASSLELGIVVARFNDHITGELLLGAVEELKARGVAEQNIDVAWVPGAFELPVVAKKGSPASSRWASRAAVQLSRLVTIRSCSASS